MSKREETGRTHHTSTCSDDSQHKSHNDSVSSPQESTSKPAENPWKSRPAADLFAGQERGANSSGSNAYNANSGQRSGYNNRPDSNQSRGYNRDADNRGDRRGQGDRRDNRDQRGAGGGGGRYNDRPTENRYKNYNEPKAKNNESHNIGFVNKFAGLQVDVDEVE